MELSKEVIKKIQKKIKEKKVRPIKFKKKDIRDGKKPGVQPIPNVRTVVTGVEEAKNVKITRADI